MVCADQHRLDAGAAQLDAQDTLAFHDQFVHLLFTCFISFSR